MKTAIITTLAVTLIGCAAPKPQSIARIVDPYTYTVYELTEAPCPINSARYPNVFVYGGVVQGCYGVSEVNKGIYFLTAKDWRTVVFYSFDQLVRSRDQYMAISNNLPVMPRLSYPSPSVPLTTSDPFPKMQCYSNGFGTISCN